VSEAEILPPPVFRPDLDEMQADIMRTHGAGRFQLWIKWKTDEGANKTLAPIFTLAPPAADVSYGEPGDGGASDALGEATDRMQRALRMKAQAAELSALSALTAEPGAPAGASSAAETLKTYLEIAKALQPDVLGVLRTAVEMVRGPAGGNSTIDQLTGLEKLAGIVERFAGGAGGGGGGARSSGWDFAIEALRQLGPNLPNLVALAAAVTARMPAAPGAMLPNVPTAPAPAPGPAVPMPAAPVPAALGDPGPDPIREAVDGDPQKAERLRFLVNLVHWEYQSPDTGDAEERAASYERAADVADTHCPGFMANLLGLGPQGAWELWMRLDPRTLNLPAAGPWVRGWVTWYQQEANRELELPR
jgi:hypothetical protein